jgi:hypothetical protein
MILPIEAVIADPMASRFWTVELFITPVMCCVMASQIPEPDKVTWTEPTRPGCSRPYLALVTLTFQPVYLSV